MALGIQVLALDMYKHVAGLNRLMWPHLTDNFIVKNNTILVPVMHIDETLCYSIYDNIE